MDGLGRKEEVVMTLVAVQQIILQIPTLYR